MRFDGERKRTHPFVRTLVDRTAKVERVAIECNKLSSGNWLHHKFKRFLAVVFPLCSCALCIHPPQIWLPTCRNTQHSHQGEGRGTRTTESTLDKSAIGRYSRPCSQCNKDNNRLDYCVYYAAAFKEIRSTHSLRFMMTTRRKVLPLPAASASCKPPTITAELCFALFFL